MPRFRYTIEVAGLDPETVADNAVEAWMKEAIEPDPDDPAPEWEPLAEAMRHALGHAWVSGAPCTVKLDAPASMVVRRYSADGQLIEDYEVTGITSVTATCHEGPPA